jgi:hypothetical protein
MRKSVFILVIIFTLGAGAIITAVPSLEQVSADLIAFPNTHILNCTDSDCFQSSSKVLSETFKIGSKPNTIVAGSSQNQQCRDGSICESELFEGSSVKGENNNVILNTEQTDKCLNSICKESSEQTNFGTSDEFLPPGITGDNNEINQQTEQNNQCKLLSSCSNSDTSTIIVTGNDNTVTRASTQDNLCSIRSNCVNNATYSIVISGNGQSSSSDSKQVNKCYVGSSCSNSGENNENICVKGAVCENSGTNSKIISAGDPCENHDTNTKVYCANGRVITRPNP